jgi:hypothetical protein
MVGNKIVLSQFYLKIGLVSFIRVWDYLNYKKGYADLVSFLFTHTTLARYFLQENWIKCSFLYYFVCFIFDAIVSSAAIFIF